MKYKQIFTYLILTSIIVGFIFKICSLGESYFGNSILNQSQANEMKQSDLLFHLLFALAIILLVSKLCGRLFLKLNQPPVMGEVIAGIALGPSLLGLISPEFLHYFIPNSLTPILGMIAQIGVILFMFLVGIDLDTELIKKKGHASIAISHASILVPFFLGAFASLWLYPRFASENVNFSVFAVFLGVAMSVTAFPVLARIVKDLRISNSPWAALTITCAAVDDVTAWCLLAFAIGIAQASIFAAVLTLFLSFVFFLFMFKCSPFILAKISQKIASAESESSGMTLVILAILITAACTEIIGIHALFGPFLLGAFIPKDSLLGGKAKEKLETLTVTLLLPVFFAFTGMKTQISLVSGLEQWGWCFLLILIASLGKIGGAFVVGKFIGIPTREALGIGILMNTRGLMELIVLNIGLELKIISPLLFTMMVIMAVVTTLLTSPLFTFVTKNKPWT